MVRNKRRQCSIAIASLALLVAGGTASGEGLRLLVDPYSGLVAMQNTSATSISIDGYQILSTAGSLLPDSTHMLGTGWDPLSDAGLPGWQAVLPTATSLSELNLSTTTSIAANGSINLGHAVTPFAEQDLSWSYSSPDGSGSENVTYPAPLQYIGGLQLQVIDLVNGSGDVQQTRAMLYNPEPVGLNLDGYVLQSISGSLNPAAFSGFAARGAGGWTSVAPSTKAISELNPTSSTVLSPLHAQPLNAAFATDGTHDLTLEFHLMGQGAVTHFGTVQYLTQLTGDANNDGIVNSQDLANVSSSWLRVDALAGDVNYDGIVNSQDLALISSTWLSTLVGHGASVGNTASVPEPSAIALLTIGLVISGCQATKLDAFLKSISGNQHHQSAPLGEAFVSRRGG